MPTTAAILVLLACLALSAGPTAVQGQTSQSWDNLRNRMVDEEIVAAGVTNPRVIRAMRLVPRHEHVPADQRRFAYLDMALPIGHSQTISPPFVVAFMTEAIDPEPEDKVLEIGTGSGYQAAILSHLVKEVYTIEIVEPLGKKAAKVLARYPNTHVKVGDGYQGWPEHAPFDKIIVTCSPEDVPPKLIEQLKEGGRMIVPVGQRYQQNLYLLRKQDGKLIREALRPTLFVPMTGEAESKREVLPDPTNPTLYNGGFEEFVEGTTQPNGWHYLRQGEVVSEGAPAGKNFLRFRNDQPGRGCGALQGLGIDGRKVKKIRMSLRLYAKDVRPGQNQQQLPAFLITFYDTDRDMIHHNSVGPWMGTFAWQTQSKVIDVPAQAREAIVRIGLFGAVGEAGFDEVTLERVDEKTP